MTKMKVGFLPLYLKLYDDVLGSMRKRIDAFNSTIQQTLRDCGLDIVAAPVWRERAEFDSAVEMFSNVCAVITLHLAYSPSLESIEALERMDKPIIVLDTTPTF